MAATITREQILEALRGVKDPELGRDLLELGMIKGVEINGSDVVLHVELTTPACPLKGQIERDITAALKTRVPEVNGIQIHFTAQVRSGMAGRQGEIPGVKNAIAVGSGKGGVGKSTVAAALALALKEHGAAVGLLDADIYGPSIPVMLGVSGQPAVTEDQMIQPLEAGGIRVMSMGFLLPKNEAVIWRGPMLHGAIQQFLHRVRWGELDYLVIDLPPTTGDVPLSLAQLIPLTGAVVVCTPQDVALADAIRAITAFRKLRIPVLGLVENMSYFKCPHCGERTEIFGTGGARLLAEQQGIPFLGGIPIDVSLRELSDQGRIAEVFSSDHPAREPLLEISRQLAAQISVEAAKHARLPKLEIIQ